MIVALALFACSSEPTPPPVENLVGIWQTGDVHVHSSVGSNDTDGLGTPEVLAEAMTKAGLDFVFLTDHSNSTGSMNCATGDVEDCPNQGPELAFADWPKGVFLANEISPVFALDTPTVPTGHIGCLPIEGTFQTERFIDRPPGTVTGGDALAQCKAAGGFAILNHPHAIAPWIEYDWTSEDFDAIEVYNGTLRFDPFDEESLGEWERRVAQGRNIVPIGASDCHRWSTNPPGSLEDPPLGWPAMKIFIVEGERPVQAIAAGRVVIAEPGTTLTLTAQRGERSAGPGERLTGPATFEATATSDVPNRLLQLKQAGGDVLAEVAIDGEVTVSLEGSAGAAIYARVWPDNPLIGTFTAGIALTNVIRVD
ncbi:MAG: CehA/McbA family metallohydrolase [Myxococcota bacterium]